VVTLMTGRSYVRKRRPEFQGKITMLGVSVMAAGMVMMAAAGMSGQRHLIEPALFVFGGGFGIYTFGGLSLMAVMSPDRHAGAYLGLWTVSVVVFKGLGTFAGGFLRDLFLLTLGLPETAAYGLVFVLSAVGLMASGMLLVRIDILGFARDNGRTLTRAEVQVAGAD